MYLNEVFSDRVENYSSHSPCACMGEGQSMVADDGSALDIACCEAGKQATCAFVLLVPTV